MTIFKETLDAEYITTAEAKEILAGVEQERALDEDREMRYELARAIDHVNRFAEMDGEDGQALVEDLLELEKLDAKTATKIADSLPQDRDEVRSVFAQERYALDGEELDEVLNVVSKYA